MRLKARTAIVTGAAQGIAAALAKAFAEEGGRVCAVDLRVESAEALVAQLGERGLDAIELACDVSRRDQVDAMVDDATRHFGRVDILINNAGITPPPCCTR